MHTNGVFSLSVLWYMQISFYPIMFPHKWTAHHGWNGHSTLSTPSSPMWSPQLCWKVKILSEILQILMAGENRGSSTAEEDFAFMMLSGTQIRVFLISSLKLHESLQLLFCHHSILQTAGAPPAKCWTASTDISEFVPSFIPWHTTIYSMKLLCQNCTVQWTGDMAHLSSHAPSTFRSFPDFAFKIFHHATAPKFQRF